MGDTLSPVRVAHGSIGKPSVYKISCFSHSNFQWNVAVKIPRRFCVNSSTKHKKDLDERPSMYSLYMNEPGRRLPADQNCELYERAEIHCAMLGMSISCTTPRFLKHQGAHWICNATITLVKLLKDAERGDTASIFHHLHDKAHSQTPTLRPCNGIVIKGPLSLLSTIVYQTLSRCCGR